jgi:hypothetical protein
MSENKETNMDIRNSLTKGDIIRATWTCGGKRCWCVGMITELRDYGCVVTDRSDGGTRCLPYTGRDIARLTKAPIEPTCDQCRRFGKTCGDKDCLAADVAPPFCFEPKATCDTCTKAPTCKAKTDGNYTCAWHSDGDEKPTCGDCAKFGSDCKHLDPKVNASAYPCFEPKTCGECAEFGAHACSTVSSMSACRCFKPKSVNDKPAWKPEINKECEWYDPQGEFAPIFVTPLFHDAEKDVWVCRKRGTARYEGLKLSVLRPLPPEPPVQVGDIVKAVFPAGDWRVGEVGLVDPERRVFTMHTNTHSFASERGYDGVKFIKLVPEAKA